MRHRYHMGRREILGAGLALGTTHVWLAHAQSPVTLTLSVWGAQAEQDAFNALISRYQSLHPNVTIRLEVNGNSMQLYQLVDTRLAGRQAPDMFRIQYQQVGRYAGAHAVIDLTPHLEQGYGSQFGPAFWQAVTYQGRQYALPHHTDTFALYYNGDIHVTTRSDWNTWPLVSGLSNSATITLISPPVVPISIGIANLI